MLGLREPISLEHEWIWAVAQVADRDWLSIASRSSGVTNDGTSEADRRVDVLVRHEVFSRQAFEHGDRRDLFPDCRDDVGNSVKVEVAQCVVGTVRDQAEIGHDPHAVRNRVIGELPEAVEINHCLHDGSVGCDRVVLEVNGRLLNQWHECAQTSVSIVIEAAVKDRNGALVDREARIVDQQEVDRLAPVGESILVVERLLRSETLLQDVALLSNEASRATVIGRIELVFIDDACAYEPLSVRRTGKGVDNSIGAPDIVPASDVVGVRIPHDHLRVDLERRDHSGGREVFVVLHRFVCIDIAQEDVIVGRHQRNRLLETNERTTSTDLDNDRRISSQRTRETTRLSIDGTFASRQVVQRTMLGLREPISLNDQWVRA